MEYLVHQQTTQAPRQSRKRFWTRRGAKMGVGLLAFFVLLVLGYVAAVLVVVGPVTAYRIAVNRNSTVETFKIFP
jgi:hypothetical protein